MLSQHLEEAPATEPSKCHGFSPLFRPHIYFLADFIAEIFVNFYDEFFVDFLADFSVEIFVDFYVDFYVEFFVDFFVDFWDKWGYTTSKLYSHIGSATWWT